MISGLTTALATEKKQISNYLTKNKKKNKPLLKGGNFVDEELRFKQDSILTVYVGWGEELRFGLWISN